MIKETFTFLRDPKIVMIMSALHLNLVKLD
jgi:hypothetical protein